MRQWGEQRKSGSSEQPQETQREISEISFQKGCQRGKGGGWGRYEGFGLFLLLGQEDGKLGWFLNRELYRASAFLLGLLLGAGKW